MKIIYCFFSYFRINNKINMLNHNIMRSDITGLRAIAVLPVLLFHAKVPFFKGGFLGVDLFFVISGYLITSNIIQGMQDGSFRFLEFYDRRARRILPALLCIALITAALSPFFMVPYDIKNFGQSLVASTFALNNLLLYLTSGYWSHAAEFKPLYHTWSLAVEEQYYFAIPILFFVFYRLYKNFKVFYFLSILIFIFSFSHSVLIHSKEYNFLMLTTRAWELMAGGLLAVFMLKHKLRPSNIIAAVGLLLIAISYAEPSLISNNQALMNIIPVLGALFVIGFSGGGEATFAGRILSMKPMIFIGLISYSIYLWHQPLISFYRLASEYEPDPYALAAFSMLSIPLAYLTWRFVENPARDKNLLSNKHFYPIIIFLTLLSSSIGLIMHKTYGFQDIFKEFSYNGNPQSYVDAPYRYQKLLNTESQGERLIVLGNSFARDFINMVDESDLAGRYQIFYDTAGCGIDERRLSSMVGNAKFVVLAGNWAQSGGAERVYYELQECVTRLKSLLGERKLFVIGAKNFGWNNSFVKTIDKGVVFHETTKPIESVEFFNNLASKNISGYIDILNLLKNSNGEVPLFTPDEKFITYDTNHLTKNGAKYLGDLIFSKTELSELRKNVAALDK